MPADLIEYEVRDNDDGIRVKIWRAGSASDHRAVMVLTGWGEVERITEIGTRTILLGREVEIYDDGEGYVVVMAWNDPDESLCQMIVVGSDGLALGEFTQVVESVREVDP